MGDSIRLAVPAGSWRRGGLIGGWCHGMPWWFGWDGYQKRYCDQIDGIGWINKRPCRISTREYVENSKGARL